MANDQKSPPWDIITQEGKKEYPLKWDNDDPATPALIWPLIREAYECAEDEKAEWNNSEFRKALTVAVEYCCLLIKNSQDSSPSLNMGDMAKALEHFIDGYMAAKTLVVKTF